MNLYVKDLNDNDVEIPEVLFEEYRKKPIVIKAFRINRILKIETLEGIMTAKNGDWLIIGVNGEIYPCKHEIFMKTYDKVEKEE